MPRLSTRLFPAFTQHALSSRRAATIVAVLAAVLALFLNS